MAFEINMPGRLDVCTLRCAGMDVDDYLDRTNGIYTGKTKIPFEVKLPYFLSDPPETVIVTRLPVDEKASHVRLRIDAPSKKIERAICDYMEPYSHENDGNALSEREHEELWKRINAILSREKMSYDDLRYGKALLNKRAIDGLIDLSTKVAKKSQVSAISDLFANGRVEKAEQERVVRWLIEEFRNNRDEFERGQLSLRIWENTIRQVGDDLVKLVENRKLGGSRSGLLMALAKSKHPRAAEIIASVLNEKYMAWAGIQALQRLKATGKYVEQIKKCLRDSNSDVRRMAKKALMKLGVEVKPPPPAVHRVKGRPKIPKELEEWSSNLDMDDVEPLLKKLAKRIDNGFGAKEIAETIGVLEDTPVEQTRALRFPITASGHKATLWIVIFMDDIDSPDLAIHTDKSIVAKLG